MCLAYELVTGFDMFTGRERRGVAGEREEGERERGREREEGEREGGGREGEREGGRKGEGGSEGEREGERDRGREGGRQRESLNFNIVLTAQGHIRTRRLGRKEVECVKQPIQLSPSFTASEERRQNRMTSSPRAPCSNNNTQWTELGNRGTALRFNCFDRKQATAIGSQDREEKE